MPAQQLRGALRYLVTIRLSGHAPLPAKRTLVLLGMAIVSDASEFDTIFNEEKEANDVFGEEQCERRALRFLPSFGFRSCLAASI